VACLDPGIVPKHRRSKSKRWTYWYVYHGWSRQLCSLTTGVYSDDIRYRCTDGHNINHSPAPTCLSVRFTGCHDTATSVNLTDPPEPTTAKAAESVFKVTITTACGLENASVKETLRCSTCLSRPYYL
jgi:hypothetical protein